MGGNRDCTVYVGNLDEKVSDKVLYEILIQAGRVVDLHIPRDKETNRHKGFAFAEYETVEIADYAVRLFSGLVTLYNRTLKFAMSGQDKSSQNMSTPTIPTQNPSPNTRSLPVQLNQIESSQHSCRFSAYPPNYAQQAPSPPGVVQPHGYVSKFHGNTYDYGRRAFGAALNGISHSDSSRKLYDSRNPVTYPSY